MKTSGSSADLAELVDANHILFANGVVDGFGHVSLRDRDEPNVFWISRSMAPARVTQDDLVAVDFEGTQVRGEQRPLYVERFIHAEIYRRWPEVNSVVHSHSPSVIPFGIVAGVPLRPVCHMSGFIGDAAPVFEIRDYAGANSDLLIRNAELGRQLADTLVSSAAVLMRGHGSTVVGRNLRQAVFRAIYLELNAKLQAQALALGPPIYLSTGEAAISANMPDAHVDRAWELWKMLLRGRSAEA